MRFFYTILVSGLLIFQEVTLDQHPPTTVDDVPYRAISSIMSELGLPSFRFPTQYKQNHSVQYQLEDEPMRAGASHDAPGLSDPVVVEAKATPTALPKVTTVDTALATYGQQSALPITGYAMYYNPNVMQEVLNNRMAMGHISACPECVGNVALLRAGDLNRRVWLEWADGTVEGPFLVADTAAKHHVSQLLARRWVVDVDNRTAVRRGMAGPVMVTVWGAPPQEATNTPPFMPLYSTMPTAAPATFPTALPTFTPIQTPKVAAATTLPVIKATPYTELVVKPAVLAVETATPVTATPLAALEARGEARRGFPTNTPVPTVTPLPVIQSTATPTASATSVPPATVASTATFVPTATLTPTANPTLVPTLTATALPTLTPTIAPTSSPTPSPTPTYLPTRVPNAGAGVTTTVTLRGFPPDTPVPTITPLPYITSTPTPLPN